MENCRMKEVGRFKENGITCNSQEMQQSPIQMTMFIMVQLMKSYINMERGICFYITDINTSVLLGMEVYQELVAILRMINWQSKVNWLKGKLIKEMRSGE